MLLKYSANNIYLSITARSSQRFCCCIEKTLPRFCEPAYCKYNRQYTKQIPYTADDFYYTAFLRLPISPTPYTSLPFPVNKSPYFFSPVYSAAFFQFFILYTVIFSVYVEIT